jgi:peroxiredoxin
MPPIDRQIEFLPNGAIKLKGATEEPLKVGDPAPDFTLAGTDGEFVSLSDQTGKAVLMVLVADVTEGSFREDYLKGFSEFVGTLPVGRVTPLVVSGSPYTANQKAAQRIGNPDLLIVDDNFNQVVLDTYSIPDTHSTLIAIDETGIVRHIENTSYPEENMFSDKRQATISRALGTPV